MSAGGHGSGNSRSDDSTHTPSDLPDEPMSSHGIGQSSKQSSREQSVCSPRKKCTKTTSLEDVVQDLDIIVKDYKRWTRAAGVCATAKCTDVCSLSSGFMKSTSFVYVAYMSNLISLGIRHLVK